MCIPWGQGSLSISQSHMCFSIMLPNKGTHSSGRVSFNRYSAAFLTWVQISTADHEILYFIQHNFSELHPGEDSRCTKLVHTENEILRNFPAPQGNPSHHCPSNNNRKLTLQHPQLGLSILPAQGPLLFFVNYSSYLRKANTYNARYFLSLVQSRWSDVVQFYPPYPS